MKLYYDIYFEQILFFYAWVWCDAVELVFRTGGDAL